MKTSVRFAFLSTALALLSVPASAAVDCSKLIASVKQAVAAKGADTLQIVEKEVAANPDCACEVVKAAIQGSNADAKLVAAIVETAATVAPKHMRLVAQCATAVAPDALANVQAVIARIDPAGGTDSKVTHKDAKDAVVAPPSKDALAGTPNPLDFPGSGVDVMGQGTGTEVNNHSTRTGRVGGNPGGPGGFTLMPWGGGGITNQSISGVLPTVTEESSSVIPQ